MGEAEVRSDNGGTSYCFLYFICLALFYLPRYFFFALRLGGAELEGAGLGSEDGLGSMGGLFREGEIYLLSPPDKIG